MASLRLNLGSAVLETAASNIQLRLTSAACFAASAEDELAHIEDLLTAFTTNNHSKLWPWIYCGDQLRFVLSIRLEDGLSSDAQRSLSRCLSARLESAELWTQLELDVSGVQVSSEASANVLYVTVFLRHVENVNASAKRALHTIGFGVPIRDIKPPAGVPSVPCSAAYLDMCLSERPRRKRRRHEARLSSFPSTDLMAETLPICQTVYEEPDDQLMDRRSQEIADYDPLQTGSSEYAMLEFFLDDEHAELDEHHSVLLEAELEDRSSLALMSPELPPSLKRPPSVNDLADGEPSLKSTTLELIDTAIRMAMSGKVVKVPKRISVTDCTSLQPLAEIAPSTWCPGYLSSVASRAVLLPTISHALTTVMHSGCTSTNSRAFSDSHRHQYQGNSDQPSFFAKDAAPDTSAVNFSALIWDMLQTTLYEPKAGRRLRSLASETGDTIAGETVEDDALDLVQVEARPAGWAGSDDEDQDLFEEEGQSAGWANSEDGDEDLFEEYAFGEFDSAEDWDDLFECTTDVHIGSPASHRVPVRSAERNQNHLEGMSELHYPTLDFANEVDGDQERKAWRDEPLPHELSSCTLDVVLSSSGAHTGSEKEFA